MPGELQDLRVGTAVASDPDIVHVVDEDAVVRRRPFVPVTGTAPRSDQRPRLVEFEHRRRREAALGRVRWILRGRHLAGGQRIAAVDDPDVVPGVHRHADGRAEQPVVRQRFRPQRVDLEHRAKDHVALCGHRPAEHRLPQHDDGNQRETDRAQCESTTSSQCLHDSPSR